MTHSLAICIVAIAVVLAGCSSPTLEEACADYCSAIESAGCDRPTAQECSGQCDGLREQLAGKCVEEYTDTLDCGAGSDFECRDGFAIATDSSCLEETLDLLECAGFVSDTTDSDSASQSSE